MTTLPRCKRSFDIDAYLDQQLAAGKPFLLREGEHEMVVSAHPVAPRRLGWLLRLDAWCGRQLDRLNGRAIDAMCTHTGTWILSGVAVYLFFLVGDLILRGVVRGF